MGLARAQEIPPILGKEACLKGWQADHGSVWWYRFFAQATIQSVGNFGIFAPRNPARGGITATILFRYGYNLMLI